MDLQCSTQCTVAITALASIELLGGCEVCNKLRALCVTPPIITFRGSHNKVVPGLQSLPLSADTCATEWKLGMARKTMRNDRIL